MYKIDNNKLISLAVYKLKDTLFNLMYDIIESPLNEICDPPDRLRKLEAEIRSLYTRLAENLDRDMADRNEFVGEINALEAKLAEAAIDINRYICVNNQLGEYMLREMKLAEAALIDESIALNNSAIAERVGHCLSHIKNDMEGAFARSNIMAALPLRMTKAKYRDYIKNAFLNLVEELPLEFAESSMNRLKDMCYIDRMEKMQEDYPLMAQEIEEIYKLPLSEFSKENFEEYFSIVDDNINFLENAYACVGVLYNDTTYMKVLSDFVLDNDFIFEDDFVLKDLYYSICDSIRDNDNALIETIADNLSDEIEKRFEASKGMEEEISRAIEKIENIDSLDEDTRLYINVNNAISDSYNRNIDYEIMLSGSGNKSADELADELCDHIEQSVKDLPLIRQKYIKQRALQHFPCLMSDPEITDYTSYSLSGVNDRAVNLMTCGDIFDITDKIEGGHDHDHDHNHHHHDHCGCGHDHH